MYQQLIEKVGACAVGGIMESTVMRIEQRTARLTTAFSKIGGRGAFPKVIFHSLYIHPRII